MNEQAEYSLNMTWKAFLLEQVNHPKSRHDEWNAWSDDSFDSRDLPPHEAAISVRERHGAEAFQRYHRALFDAHHEADRDLTEPATLVAIAEELDLDGQQLQSDLEQHAFREAVGADHLEGEEDLGVFGVPTVLFEDSQPIFLKLGGGDWEGTDDVELFESIHRTAATRPHLLTMKKPSQAADRPGAPERF